MRKILTLVGILLCGLSAWAQIDDPVVMIINGKSITRSEFEYSYNKNNSESVIERKTVEEYVPLYVNFKLKVAEAERQQMDTLMSVRRDLDSYKEQIVMPTLVDSAFIEREARRTYDLTAVRFDEVLSASHILIRLPQSVTPLREAQAKARIDSLHSVLNATPKEQLADRFAEMAKQFSEHPSTAQRGGALGEFGRGMMDPDFEKAAFALQPGQLSAPFKSSAGFHLVLLTDRHPFGSYEQHRADILRFLSQRGIREASAKAYIDSVSTVRQLSRAQVIDLLLEDMKAKDDELRNLSQEYYDGTMMYEVEKKDVWDKARLDSVALEKYFSAHKKDYKWTEPRFCGVVVHAKNSDVQARVKSLLKGRNEKDYKRILDNALNTDSTKLVRVEEVLVAPGSNPFVDKLFFKKTVQPDSFKNYPLSVEDYPAAATYGKKLKKPRTYSDVMAHVVADLQTEQEQLWIDLLRQRYPVQIFDDVVKTVNKH